ncbi:MAG: hypothetical protein K2L56_08070 [Prevotella sp.]|nr:hypothetical protein [Prevotella sp.]
MKTRKMMIKTVMAVVFAVVALSSCTTDVDLCYKPEHPHQAKVKYEFNWGSYAKNIAANDSMYIIADRVINHWKAAMKVSPVNPVRGRFMFNGPETADDNRQSGEETPGVTPEPPAADDFEEELPGESDKPVDEGVLASPRREITESTRAGNSEQEPSDSETATDTKPAVPQTGTLTEFQIRPGDYKFIAFRVNDEEMIYSDVDKYLMDETGEMRLQDIYAEYKVYSKGDEGLRKTLVDWQDYNPYAQYIQPDIHPVFYDTLPARRIETGATVTCRFSPRPVTQHIDINFTIKKKLNLVGKGKDNDVRFFVDSVWIEMAGVPREINLANGYLKIDRTCKVMTKADEIKDRETSTSVKVHGAIDVPSIVRNNTPDVGTGPGILQVIIFAHSVVYDEKGNAVPNPSESDGIAKKKKKIQGKINLYNTLRNANLMTVASDGRHAVRNGAKGVLNIVADIVVDGNNILENDDNTGGIDPWVDCTDRIIVDI